jgi:hypothetical protein
MELAKRLDAILTDLEQWIPRAGESMLTFWDPDRRQFIRETFQRDPQSGPPLGKTSTNRALSALIDMLRYLAEELADTSDLAVNAQSIVADLYQGYLARLPEDPRSVRSSDVNGVNMFTDAHLILAVSVTDSWLARSQQPPADTDRWPSQEQRAIIHNAVSGIVNENLAVLSEQLGGRVHPLDLPHDFVTLYAVRAVDAFAVSGEGTEAEWPESLIRRVERDVLAQIGFYSAGAWSQFDPGELAFSTVLLDRLAGAQAQQLTMRATEIMGSTQTADGSWPSSRVISYGGERLLHVASCEIALALVIMLLNQQSRGVVDAADLIFPILNKSFGLIKTTFVRVGEVTGWANDRTRWTNLAESWATAIVLAFLIRYRDAAISCRQDAVLASYYVARPRHSFLQSSWADLRPIIEMPHQVAASAMQLSDPTEHGTLAQSLVDNFIAPILTSAAIRPRHTSLIVPGPPGTRKIRMIQAIAQGLGWPLVILSPSDFLVDGLDGFVRHSAAVFQDLMRLRRAVVLFDESEDFFRKRDGDDSTVTTGTRTVGAFITQGVLPGLEALKRQRWVLFILVTNTDLTVLDPDLVRSGLIDYQVRLENPTLAAQRRYLESATELGSRERGILDQALQAYAEKRESAEQQVTWTVLDYLTTLASSGDPPGVDELLAVLAERIQRSGPPRLPGL